MSVNIGNSWDELLEDEWNKDYYKKIKEILIHDYKNYKVYPGMNFIFEVSKLVPFEGCKVVILGQDPYHSLNQTHGLSFSVKPNVKTPPSLINIYRELQNEFGHPIPNNGYSMKWAKQGVLLLNTSLTVIESRPDSHSKIGWQILMDKIIELLGNSNGPIVFISWGNNAKMKKDLIKSKNALILESPHPSPSSANRGFFGCNHFIKTNDYLMDNDLEPIDWRIESV